MSGDLAIEMRGGAIAFGGREVWRDLDVTVPAGEFVAVLGPNGVGKSTLLQAVLGLQQLDRGSVRVFGDSPDRARSLVGYLPQRRTFDASLRIRGIDVVRLGADGRALGRHGLPRCTPPGARASPGSPRRGWCHSVRDPTDRRGLRR